MADITTSKIRYTIQAIVEYEAKDVVDIQTLMDTINEYGEWEIIKWSQYRR